MDELRKQYKEIEIDIEHRVDELEAICGALDPEYIEVTDSPKPPEEKIKGLLSRLFDQMIKTIEEMSELAHSTLESSRASAFRSSYNTLLKRYRAISKLIEEKRWKQQLIGKQVSQPDSTQMEYLIQEGKHIDTALEMASNVLLTAGDVRSSLSVQRTTLESTGDKLVNFAETLPGINLLLGRISRRKRLNAVVIGLTIAICVLLIIGYWAYM